MQRGNGIGSFCRGLFCLVKPLFQGKGGSKRGVGTGSNIITDILNRESEMPVGAIFKNRCSETEGNFQEKIKNFSLDVNVGR